MKIRIAALATALVACSNAAPATPAAAGVLPRSEVVEKLDAGQVASLPTGTVYVRFIRFVQPPGYVINSKQHVPSVVYVQVGLHRLILAGQAPIDLAAGQAKFHQSVTHQHLNPGTDASTWYSIAVWPSSARGQPLVDRIAQAAFESEDVDRVSLPDVSYTEVLRLVTLSSGGTSGAHMFGGLITLYVLSGSIMVQAAHQGSKTLDAGQGAAFLPQTALLESNPGRNSATYLQFVVIPNGAAFEVPLQHRPAA